jgi:hypothetical protein
MSGRESRTIAISTILMRAHFPQKDWITWEKNVIEGAIDAELAGTERHGESMGGRKWVKKASQTFRSLIVFSMFNSEGRLICQRISPFSA